MHNSERPKSFTNVSGEESGGDKISPDAVVFESGTSEYHNLQRERQARKEKLAAEKAQRDKKTRGFWKKVGGTAAVTAAAATLALGGCGEKEPKPMPKEAWEETAKGNLGRYSDAKLEYSDNGSVISFKEKRDVNGETIQTQYYLQDPDNDSLIEFADASNKLGGAEFETDGEGVRPLEAIRQLNEQMGFMN